ncbi:hypothetical protein ACGFW5_31160 [Streptomyces sp. NPDC048416]|uniref:hypothetical protein n=1 Tax=Streptomyces sp. NPDC048416 TaxID=3365546 RepID=UPI003712F4BF
MGGLGWAAYGYLGILNDPGYARSRSLDYLTAHVPLTLLGWGWVVCGLVAVLAGLVASHRQSVGFGTLAVPAAVWAAAFTISASRGYGPAAGSAAAWVSFAILITMVSGMEDPLPPHLRKRGD